MVYFYVAIPRREHRTCVLPFLMILFFQYLLFVSSSLLFYLLIFYRNNYVYRISTPVGSNTYIHSVVKRHHRRRDQTVFLSRNSFARYTLWTRNYARFSSDGSDDRMSFDVQHCVRVHMRLITVSFVFFPPSARVHYTRCFNLYCSVCEPS